MQRVSAIPRVLRDCCWEYHRYLLLQESGAYQSEIAGWDVF